MRSHFSFLILCLSFSFAPVVMSQAPSTPACTVEKGFYSCNQAAFLAALKDAKTVAVLTKPFDQGTTNSLGRLARSLNKTEVSSSPDLTFVMIRTQSEGIFFGPSDRQLASFLVYTRNPQETGSQLIWIETFHGDPDMVWPIAVYNIIRQFKVTIQ